MGANGAIWSDRFEVTRLNGIVRRDGLTRLDRLERFNGRGRRMQRRDHRDEEGWDADVCQLIGQRRLLPMERRNGHYRRVEGLDGRQRLDGRMERIHRIDRRQRLDGRMERADGRRR